MKIEQLMMVNKHEEACPTDSTHLYDLEKEFAAFTSDDYTTVNSEHNDNQIEKEILISTIKLLKNSGEKYDIKDVGALSLNKINLDKFLIAEFMLNNRRDSLSLGDIREYETIQSDKNQMEKIYTDNYSANKELQNELVLDFNNFIKGDSKYYQNKKIITYGSEMFDLKYNNQIISFNRFDMLHGNKLYFKSFNVDKSIQGSGIGQMMCRATLDEKAQGHTIIADCTSSKPISSFYIESGFIAIKFSIDYGESHLSIIRDDKTIPNEFKTKTMSKEDLVLGKNLPDGSIVNRSSTQENCDFNYIIPENFERPGDKIPNHYPKEKYVLTRYFYNSKTNEWITVFESVKRDLNDFL